MKTVDRTLDYCYTAPLPKDVSEDFLPEFKMTNLVLQSTDQERTQKQDLLNEAILQT
jgi:hypothetical protein